LSALRAFPIVDRVSITPTRGMQMYHLNPQRHLPLIIGAVLAVAITVLSALAVASLAARPI
jgi:hypothetical protein